MCTSWDHSPYRDLCTDHHTGVRSQNLSLQCNSWILTCKDNVRTVQLEGSILNSLSKIQTWDLLACFRSFQPQLVCFLHGWSFFAVMLCGWITEGSARQRPRTTRLSGAPGARASVWSDCYTFHRASQTYDYMAHKMTTRGYKQLQPYTKWLQKDTNNYNQTQNDYKETHTTTTRHKMTTKRHKQLQRDTTDTSTTERHKDYLKRYEEEDCGAFKVSGSGCFKIVRCPNPPLWSHDDNITNTQHRQNEGEGLWTLRFTFSSSTRPPFYQTPQLMFTSEHQCRRRYISR